MKEKSCSLKLRVWAFVTLILFTVTSCPIPSLPEPDAMVLVPGRIGITVAHRPVSFHLADDYQPSVTETRKTAFILRDVDAAKNFVITAETEDDGTVVRFMASDTDTIVSLYFDKAAPFPRGFAMNAGGDTAYGVFSDYKENETFDLTLKSNGEEPETFEGIVMNKNVLAAYQDNDDFSPEHNERMRAYVTALGVWMAVTLHFDRETAENQVSAVPSAVSGGTNPLAGFSLNDEESGFRKAVENISGLGAAAGAFFHGVFALTTEAAVTAGAAVEAKVAAPVVAVIAGVTAVAATVEIEKEANQPPAQPNAPHLRFYYFDELDAEQPIPVMRTDAEPSPAQSVYIEPNGRGSDYTSNVRLYYQVIRSGFADTDQVTDIPTLDGVITPYGSKDNKHYQAVFSGTDDEKGAYFEVQKSDGFIGTDARRQTKLVFTVYDGNQPVKTPYPSFYANGIEFNGATDFAISFFDYVNDSEKAEVVIPPHTETEITSTTIILQNQWLDFGAHWTPLIYEMDSTALTLLVFR
jgi:hypothetical protein